MAIAAATRVVPEPRGRPRTRSDEAGSGLFSSRTVLCMVVVAVDHFRVEKLRGDQLRSPSDVAGGNGGDVTMAVKLVIGLVEAGAGPGFQDAVDVGKRGTVAATKGADRGVGVGNTESLQIAGDFLGIPIDGVSP